MWRFGLVNNPQWTIMHHLMDIILFHISQLYIIPASAVLRISLIIIKNICKKLTDSNNPLIVGQRKGGCCEGGGSDIWTI